MTIEETIKSFEENIENTEEHLEEFSEKYRAAMQENIEMFELAVDALKKRVPTKPKITYAGDFGMINEYYCPNCDEYLTNTEDEFLHYCSNCGQHLDWRN